RDRFAKPRSLPHRAPAPPPLPSADAPTPSALTPPRSEGASRRRNRTPRGRPVQPAGDHQMDYGEEAAIESDHDSLAEPAHARHPFALERRGSGLDRAQDERAAEAQPDQ